MKQVVIDTSVMMRLVGVHGPDAIGPAELAVANVNGQAPELLLVECAHVLGKSVRRKHLTDLQALENMARIRALVNVHTTIDDPTEYLSLALELKHSAYDVRFFVLAQRLGIPLLTADENFVTKLQEAKIQAAIELVS